MHPKNFSIAIVMASLCALSTLSLAVEGPEPETDDKLVRELLWGQSWGASREEMLSAIKERFDNSWRVEASQLDAYEVDQRIRASRERFQQVTTSFQELDQGGREYLASPLNGEFGLGLGQSVMRLPLQKLDRYFLFQQARLAKVVEVVPASSVKNFKTFVAGLAKRFGRRTIPVCGDAEPTARNAVLKGQSSEPLSVCVLDRTRLYSAFLLVINDPKTPWILKAQAPKSDDALTGLPDIFSEDPTAEDNQALVDEITGVKVKNRGNSKRQNTKTVAPKKKATPKKATSKKKKGLYEDQDVLY